jgi:hypothetical protein
MILDRTDGLILNSNILALDDTGEDDLCCPIIIKFSIESELEPHCQLDMYKRIDQSPSELVIASYDRVGLHLSTRTISASVEGMK